MQVNIESQLQRISDKLDGLEHGQQAPSVEMRELRSMNESLTRLTETLAEAIRGNNFPTYLPEDNNDIGIQQQDAVIVPNALNSLRRTQTLSSSWEIPKLTCPQLWEAWHFGHGQVMRFADIEAWMLPERNQKKYFSLAKFLVNLMDLVAVGEAKNLERMLPLEERNLPAPPFRDLSELRISYQLIADIIALPKKTPSGRERRLCDRKWNTTAKDYRGKYKQRYLELKNFYSQ